MWFLPRRCATGWQIFWLCVAAALGAVLPGAALAAPAVALYYGDAKGLEDFRAFDVVVVDAEHLSGQPLPPWPGTQLFAYASVGEVLPSRAYAARIPATWKVGTNTAWASTVIDQSAPEWPEFFATQVIAPLWAQGFRGFFLDTLDSWQLVPGHQPEAQQQGLVRVINTLHQRFPGIQLILNRGFDILPQVHDKVAMVAAESLYRRWNQAQRQYQEVPQADRQWLRGQLDKVRAQWQLPVLVIDYVPPHDRALARSTAQQIQADGFIPWVSDGALTSVGIGSIEPIPRRILVVYNSSETPALNYSDAHRFVHMPLNHLGYAVDYADALQDLPPQVDPGKYAGIVLYFSGFIAAERRLALERWLLERLEGKIPMALMGRFPMLLSRTLAERWGLQTGTSAQAPLRTEAPHPMLGLEAPVPAPGEDDEWPQLLPAMASQAQALLRLTDAKGRSYAPGAIMPWGGYVLEPYTLAELPGTGFYRWVVDPFAFLSQALRLPALPIPDTTTENGRRLLLAHVDGDGFPSVAELPGRPLAAEVLLKDVFERYRLPHTMSIVESEVSPQGLYPDLSPRLESIAQKMFRLPQVEAASHTFSHPFLWDVTAPHGKFSENSDAAHALSVPGYTMDLRREIVGSIDYLRQRLVPPGKPVRILQWSGDTAPGSEALQIIQQENLLNINGGDTYTTHANRSLTAIRSLGIEKNGVLQVYAPITNENIYTNEWTGPFYGYQRAIETFELTGSPRRIKPVGIYYHTYSASKAASLKALHKVYAWALEQPLHPVHTSEFITKVQDFHHLALAREGQGWRVRGSGALRTLRVPAALGIPDIDQSQGVAGWSDGPEGRYVHLTGGQALLHTTPNAAPATTPTLQQANARLAQWDMARTGGSFELQGHVPLEFSLVLPPGCQTRTQGRPLAGALTTNHLYRFKLANVAARIQILCPTP